MDFKILQFLIFEEWLVKRSLSTYKVQQSNTINEFLLTQHTMLIKEPIAMSLSVHITWLKRPVTRVRKLCLLSMCSTWNCLHIGLTTLSFAHRKLVLKDVLHVPTIAKVLLNVSKLTQHNNVIIEFHSRSSFVKNKLTGQRYTSREA